MSEVRLENVHKTYAEGGARRTVLKGVDLDIEAGEVIALLGTSGSGKTTLLNLISGIDQPDRGRITIADEEVSALREPQRTLFRRARIGFVFQFFNLIPTLTVAENIRVPLDLVEMDKDTAGYRVGDLLERVGLGDRRESFPENLSGGEQQRAAVARALAHRPDLVLADEPTGNLDAHTGESVMDLLTELAREQDTTVFIVTHSDAVARAADRCLRLADGHITP
ncbi:MAG: ABC transporter ATP-binding protein [Gammaproteobacteria bacterium]